MRVLLSIGSAGLFWKPEVLLFGRKMLLFDVGGSAGIAGMALLLLYV